MKNYSLLLIVSLLIAQCAISQNFISEGKHWNVKEDFWGDITTEIFKIEGDSIVNTINYKKVWSTNDSTMVNWWFTGLIREDSGKVFFKNEYGNEGILYDFNLEAGDTAYVTNLYCDVIQIIINSIDTVNYLGVDRKRWSLAWSEEYWLAGIGSTCGPFHSNFFNCIFDVWFELLCFSENDTLFYMNQGEDDCFQYYVGLDEKPNFNQLIVGPNPTLQGQSFTIQANTIINEVCIYNAGGALVKNISPGPQQNISVETDQLKSGLYLLRIKTDANQVFSQKMIIK